MAATPTHSQILKNQFLERLLPDGETSEYRAKFLDEGYDCLAAVQDLDEVTLKAWKIKPGHIPVIRRKIQALLENPPSATRPTSAFLTSPFPTQSSSSPSTTLSFPSPLTTPSPQLTPSSSSPSTTLSSPSPLTTPSPQLTPCLSSPLSPLTPSPQSASCPSSPSPSPPLSPLSPPRASLPKSASVCLSDSPIPVPLTLFGHKDLRTCSLSLPKSDEDFLSADAFKRQYQTLEMIRDRSKKFMIWKIQDLDTKRFYAMKQTECSAKRVVARLKKQYLNWAQLKSCQHVCDVHHGFVIAYEDSKVTKYHWSVLMTYYSAGDLYQRIQKANEEHGLTKTHKDSVALVNRWLYQLALGLREIHDLDLVHGDIDLANIYIDSSESLKLGDFGTTNESEQKAFCSASDDMYAFGKVLLSLMTLSLSPDPKEDVKKIPKWYPKEVKQIVQELLNSDEEKRPTAKQLVQRLTLEVKGKTHYKSIRHINSGGFGSVYEVQDERSGKIYALKVINRQNASKISELKKEFETMQRFRRFPWFCRVHDCFSSKLKEDISDRTESTDIVHLNWSIVMTRYPDDLFSRITKAIEAKSLSGKSRFDDEQLILRWTTEIAEGIAQLHDAKVIHRDIKPANLFLDKLDRIKIGDFGICHQGDTFASTQCSTPGYFAPEIVGDRYSYEVDMWSLGCVLLDLLSLSWPDSSGSVETRISKIPPDYNKELTVMVQNLLQPEASKRWTAVQLLQKIHDFKGSCYVESNKISVEGSISINKVQDIRTNKDHLVRMIEVVDSADELKAQFYHMQNLHSCPFISPVCDAYSLTLDKIKKTYWCVVLPFHGSNLVQRMKQGDSNGSLTGEGLVADGPLVLKWLSQLVRALRDIHDHNLMLCNLAPTNIFIDSNTDLKILPFAVPTSKINNLPSSHGYTAPEIYNKKTTMFSAEISRKADIYSLGQIIRDLSVFAHQFRDGLLGISKKLLNPDPHKRPDTATVMKQLFTLGVKPRRQVQRRPSLSEIGPGYAEPLLRPPSRTPTTRGGDFFEGFPKCWQCTKKVELFKVPFTGRYQFGVQGSQGGGKQPFIHLPFVPLKLFNIQEGGHGAMITATFELCAGDTLKLLVGEQGATGDSNGGGGGGGSFVIKVEEDGQEIPLIVSGGGGGTGSYDHKDSVGRSASLEENGTNGEGKYGGQGEGGKDGLGGTVCKEDGGEILGGSGAGWKGDGTVQNRKSLHPAMSFGKGGVGGRSTAAGPRGGFGGGGCGSGGGGGGYSGGGGGGWGGGGGGGGSYVDASRMEPLYKEVNGKGNGFIAIDLELEEQ